MLWEFLTSLDGTMHRVQLKPLIGLLTKAEFFSLCSKQLSFPLNGPMMKVCDNDFLSPKFEDSKQTFITFTFSRYSSDGFLIVFPMTERFNRER